MVPQEPRVMVFEKQITIIKIILSTNFDDLIIEISDIIILIIQISFRKNQSVVLLLPKVNLLMSDWRVYSRGFRLIKSLKVGFKAHLQNPVCGFEKKKNRT